MLSYTDVRSLSCGDDCQRLGSEADQNLEIGSNYGGAAIYA